MSTPLTQKTILLADDDLDDAEMFEQVLKEIDPAVMFYHAKDGLGVFKYLQNTEKGIPNIIFLDLNMPEMSGWQCLTALKGSEATKEIPVLIYSTSSQLRDKQTAAEMGASGFITKPSDYKSLQRILRTIVANLHENNQTQSAVFDNLR